MPIIKDGKTYYTLEESSKNLEKRFEEKADIFVQRVLEGQKLNHTDVTEITNV